MDEVVSCCVQACERVPCVECDIDMTLQRLPECVKVHLCASVYVRIISGRAVARWESGACLVAWEVDRSLFKKCSGACLLSHASSGYV